MMEELPKAAAVWRQAPSDALWDPATAVRSTAGDSAESRFVPFDSLLSDLRQGVAAASLGRGDFRVRTVRVSDVWPLILGAGETRELHSRAVQRNLLFPGDVVVSRVGRLGQASCVTKSADALVAREGVLVARPLQKEWGPALAAALCTDHVRDRLNKTRGTARSAILTKEELGEVLVPSPNHFDFKEIASLLEAAGKLVAEGYETLESVREQIDRSLEGAPTEPLQQQFAWMTDPTWLPGWGWTDVQRELLVTRTRLPETSLIRLDEIMHRRGEQAKTVFVETPVPALRRDDIRSDWYLAIPAPWPEPPISDPVQKPRSDSRREFLVTRECLLIPTVGDIAAPPVVIPGKQLRQSGSQLRVAVSWLPLQGLEFPRAIAVLLDHPFLRLQRRLAAAFSTVTHLTREDIFELRVPDLFENAWNGWEIELEEAHDLFIEAGSKARLAVAIIERWYA